MYAGAGTRNRDTSLTLHVYIRGNGINQSNFQHLLGRVVLCGWCAVIGWLCAMHGVGRECVRPLAR
jgi:hypothetical protein